MEHEYDALGQLIGTTSSTGLSTSREYDAAGRLIAETDVLGCTMRYEYDPDGKRNKMIDPRGNVFEFEYDAGGHQIAMRFPDGSSVSYEYNDQDKKISETDQLGHTTSFEWNDLGLLREMTDPLGHRTRYSYNEIGNLLSQTDANNHTTSFEYNKPGRRTKKTYPLGMSQSTSYDVANRTVSVTDFHGETTTSQYDTLGRVVTITFPDDSSQRYTYTSSGQIASVTDRHGTTEYQYDSDERLSAIIDANGATISYTYDAFGRRQTVTTPSGTTGYGYDMYGRLISVTDPDGAETRYTYDEHGNKASMISPNGTITEYGYDTLNRLISVETRTMTNDLLAAYSYTLNAKGQRTHVEEQPIGRTIEYDYDAADRLIAERISDPVLGNCTISYTYDPVGNRLTKNDNGVITEYAYDDNDRLLTENGFSYTYDHNGNLLTKSGDGEEWQLTYNTLNQVTRANIMTPQGASVINYAYDHDGIRIGKTINGTEVVQYMVDKNRPYAQVLEEERTNGLLSDVTNYVYGDALISSTTEGLTHYYHADGLGSVRRLSDASGALTDSYTYDAYGLLTASSGVTVNPYLYRGEQYDAGLNAYYLRARYYQPGTGRFLTTDPMEGFPTTPISLHRYMYGNANPGNMLDPSGKMSINEAIITTAIIGNLSAIAVGTCSEAGQQAYADFGEYIFPDAFVLGVNGYMSIPLTYMLQSALGLPHTPTQANYIRAYGREILFSVTSGQIGYFKTKTHGTEIGANLPIGEIVVEVYRGMVWNLWNADNYEGPFHSLSLNLPQVDRAPALSGSLFFDAVNTFKGSWGVGRSIWSSSNYQQKIHIGYGYIDYRFNAATINYRTEAEIIASILTSIYITNIFVNSQSLGMPANMLELALHTTLWVQTGMAKYFWNNSSTGYRLETLQNHPRKDYPNFQSGPGLFFAGQYLVE